MEGLVNVMGIKGIDFVTYCTSCYDVSVSSIALLPHDPSIYNRSIDLIGKLVIQFGPIEV